MANGLLRLSAAALTVLAMLPGPEAKADDTGFASIHTWRKVGKKTCMLDHYHSGQGSGQTTKAAESAAIANWASFTSLEYGSDWASYKIAEKKTMKCAKEDATSWTCNTDALPCRPR
jgi:hypothetical protein